MTNVNDIPYPTTEDEWVDFFFEEAAAIQKVQDHFEEYGTLNPKLWGWISAAMADDLDHKLKLVRTKDDLAKAVKFNQDLALENSRIMDENRDLQAQIEDLRSQISNNLYPEEELGEYDDDGTMPRNVETLEKLVVGHKIVNVEKGVDLPSNYRDRYYMASGKGTALTLDNGKRVYLVDTSDCCAYTEVQSVIAHLDKIDHAITGIGTTDGYETWHIYADIGDVVELKVGWSSGNPFYYGYGFDIQIFDPETEGDNA